MPKQLKILSERCIGCKSCELACSLANEGVMNPSISRIRAITFLEGKYRLPYNLVTTCRQCADAPCLSSCPVDALSRSKDNKKAVLVDRDLCIGCGRCVDACPFGVMFFDGRENKAYKCELCGGNPACAAICPSGALEYGTRRAYYTKAEDCLMQGCVILSRQNKENTRDRKGK